MDGKFLTLSISSPFVLRLSKDERRVFQQNRCSTLAFFTVKTEGFENRRVVQ